MIPYQERLLTRGFLLMLADEYILIFISLSPIIGLDLIIFSFLLLTSTSVFQLALVPGRASYQFLAFANTRTLATFGLVQWTETGKPINGAARNSYWINFQYLDN